MIIVEGPDGSGKTTLVKRLEEELGITREPRAVSKDAQALMPVDDYIERELSRGFGLRLYDRFALISSPCYMMLPNRTFSGKMATDIDWLRAQYSKFARVDPMVVVCLPSLETVMGNTRVGKHDGLNLEAQIEEIYLHYVNWYATQVNNSSVMLWDYHNPNGVRLGNLINWVQGRVKKGR